MSREREKRLLTTPPNPRCSGLARARRCAASRFRRGNDEQNIDPRLQLGERHSNTLKVALEVLDLIFAGVRFRDPLIERSDDFVRSEDPQLRKEPVVEPTCGAASHLDGPAEVGKVGSRISERAVESSEEIHFRKSPRDTGGKLRGPVLPATFKLRRLVEVVEHFHSLRIIPSLHVILKPLFEGDAMPKDEDEKRLTVDIPAELHRRAKIRAAELGVDLRVIVIEGLQLRLAQKDKKAGGR